MSPINMVPIQDIFQCNLNITSKGAWNKLQMPNHVYLKQILAIFGDEMIVVCIDPYLSSMMSPYVLSKV
jgi:hypothetical protein